MNIFLDTDERSIHIRCSTINGEGVKVHVLKKNWDNDLIYDGTNCRRRRGNELFYEELCDELPLLKRIYDTTMECMKGLVVFYEMEGKDTYYINHLYRRMKVHYSEEDLCNAIRNIFTTFVREA